MPLYWLDVDAEPDGGYAVVVRADGPAAATVRALRAWLESPAGDRPTAVTARQLRDAAAPPEVLTPSRRWVKYRPAWADGDVSVAEIDREDGDETVTEGVCPGEPI